MKIEGNKYIFENDDELTDFCMNQNPSFYKTESGLSYYDYEMTPEYEQAVKDGVEFVVMDPNSRAVKNGHINRGLITKCVDCYGPDEWVEHYGIINIKDYRRIKTPVNERILADKILTRRDFFVYDETGWGKTASVMKYADEFQLTVVTVCLDVIKVTDLGGTPVPQTKKIIDHKNGGEKKIEFTTDFLPAWAGYMAARPHIQFLLFFDGLHLEDIKMMTALKSIILTKTICGVKFDNFFVGVEGNYTFDGVPVDKLPIPFRSCLAVVRWERNWDRHFAWAHKNYDDKVGAELIDKVESLKKCWESPRAVTRNIYDWVSKSLKNDELRLEPEDYYYDLEENTVCRTCPMGSSAVDPRAIKEFAEWVYDYVEERQAK